MQPYDDSTHYEMILFFSRFKQIAFSRFKQIFHAGSWRGWMIHLAVHLPSVTITCVVQ
jgi:hypothetical protein